MGKWRVFALRAASSLIWGRGAKEQTTAYNLRGTVKVNLPRVTTLDYNRSDMLLLKYAVLEYAA